MSSSKIYVVGVGPGDKELITLKASSMIYCADYVTGFRSALAVIEHLIQGQAITLDYHNQEALIQKTLELSREGHSCVMCVCGDPNVSDRQLIERLNVKGVEIEVIPGISSIQSACARLRLPLDGAFLVTFHQRGSIEEEKRQLLEQAKLGKRNLIVLPRPWDFMPAEVARYLLQGKVNPNTKVAVLQNVTLENESVIACTLSELAEKQETLSDLTILVIRPNTTGGDTSDGEPRDLSSRR